jgi:hypothetical protein
MVIVIRETAFASEEAARPVDGAAS